MRFLNCFVFSSVANLEVLSRDSSHPRVERQSHQREDFEQYRQCPNFPSHFDTLAYESRSVCRDEYFEHWILVWSHLCDATRTCRQEDERNQTMDSWISIYVWTQNPKQSVYTSLHNSLYDFVRSWTWNYHEVHRICFVVVRLWFCVKREREKERERERERKKEREKEKEREREHTLHPQEEPTTPN